MSEAAVKENRKLKKSLFFMSVIMIALLIIGIVGYCIACSLPGVMLYCSINQGLPALSDFDITMKAAASGDDQLFENIQDTGLNAKTLMKYINNIRFNGSGSYDLQNNSIYMGKSEGSLAILDYSGSMLITDEKAYFSFPVISDKPLTVKPADFNILNFTLSDAEFKKEAADVNKALLSVISDYINENKQIISKSADFKQDGLETVVLHLNITQIQTVLSNFLDKISENTTLKKTQ